MSYPHYLRIEGVNLDNFVSDTRQLSVIRGGSLQLLQAIQDIEKKFKDQNILTTLSKGASIGLFGVHAGADLEQVKNDVRSILSHQGYEHGTFVVNVVPAEDKGFRQDAERALAANRWQQMQASSLSLPARNEEAVKNSPACAFDWLRPASLKHEGPNLDNGERQFLSESACSRWRYGRDAKQKFYSKLTLIPEDQLPKFANEFEDIASGTGKLNGKMAVFYADGNKFGKWQQKLCKIPDDQEKWDQKIRGKREIFLKTFLSEEVLQKKEWKNEKGQIRFETLLWGGDELMFVMPAELAWRFAIRFFHHFGGWEEFTSQGTAQLTHTAAIVCCHHHSPINRLQRLLKEQMAEFAKDAPGGRKRDQLLFLAMESFDNLGVSFESGMRRRYGDGMKLEDLILHGDTTTSLHKRLEAFSSALEILKQTSSDFSRSQLRALATKIVQHLMDHPDSKAIQTDLEIDSAFKEYFFRADKKAKDAVKEANVCHSSTAALWIQLEELWDYALP